MDHSQAAFKTTILNNKTSCSTIALPAKKLECWNGPFFSPMYNTVDVLRTKISPLFL